MPLSRRPDERSAAASYLRVDVTVLRSSDARVAGSHFNKVNASHMAPARHGNMTASGPSKGISEMNHSPRRLDVGDANGS
jgi:hypothetical protein